MIRLFLAETNGRVDDDLKQIFRGLVPQRMARSTDDTLRAKPHDQNGEVRAAAANASLSLVTLMGENFESADGVTIAECFVASQKWTAGLASRAGK